MELITLNIESSNDDYIISKALTNQTKSTTHTQMFSTTASSTTTSPIQTTLTAQT